MDSRKIRTYWNFARTSLTRARWQRVHFLVPSRAWGSSITRGDQISGQFNRMGIYSRVFETKYSDGFRDFKNSMFIISKVAIEGQEALLDNLKKNGNLLVWDPMDGLLDYRHSPELQLLDGVVLSNRRCADEVRSFFPRGCHLFPLHHHWDPRCRPHHAKEFRIIFVGDPTPENIAPGLKDGVPELNFFKVSGSQSVKQQNLFEAVREYSCHFSVREEGSSGFKLKPNVKLAFASATLSNIIVSRDDANVELLDPEYPFYTASDLVSVRRTVALAKESFGGPLWRQALDMMSAVRERSSLAQVCRDYLAQLRILDEKKK